MRPVWENPPDNLIRSFMGYLLWANSQHLQSISCVQPSSSLLRQRKLQIHVTRWQLFTNNENTSWSLWKRIRKPPPYSSWMILWRVARKLLLSYCVYKQNRHIQPRLPSQQFPPSAYVHPWFTVVLSLLSTAISSLAIRDINTIRYDDYPVYRNRMTFALLMERSDRDTYHKFFHRYWCQ